MDDIIRKGRISAINYDTGRARVVYVDKDNCTTKEIPFLSRGIYSIPSIGDMVVVSHFGNNPAEAVILGTFYTDKNTPAESGAGLVRIELGDGAYIKGTSGDIELATDKKVKIKGAASVDIESDGTVTISGADISLVGNVNVVGNLTVNGRAVELV